MKDWRVMRGLDDLRFHFVTGKGGVGKSTVSVALAVRLTAQGRRVLLTVAGSTSQVERLLEVEGIGHHPIEARPNLLVVRIDPDESMREYAQLVLHSEALATTVFHNKYVRGFFRGIPGLRDWAQLGKAWFLCQPDASGRAPYDAVVFDAPATGHGTDLLRVPRIIQELAPSGRMRDDAEAAWRMLSNPNESGIFLVTLPEELPTTETLELADAVRGELGLPVRGLVINRCRERYLTGEERKQLLALEVQGGALLDDDPPDPAVAATLFYAIRRAAGEASEEEHMVRLDQLGLPTVCLPWLREESVDFSALEGLAERFGAFHGP